MTVEFDAVVVGSGVTGGWAAKELTESGLKVLLLERGRNVEHGKDYPTEHAAPWEMEFRGLGNRRLYASDYPLQSQELAFSEYTEHFFANEREQPYLQTEDRPFYWVRGNQLGGKSLLWARQVYRWSDLDFTANRSDGHGIDWPIRYKDIEPWYDHVEAFIGVSGQAEELPQLPDGKFLPPMELNCVEKRVRDAIAERYEDRLLTIGRVAVLTEPLHGRGACHYCGPCERGCSVGAYFSSQSSTLPAAEATGNLTTLTDCIVASLKFDAHSRRVTAVRCIDAKTKTGFTVRGRIVFLCGSTLGSTQVLLNSRSESASNGLGNSSGVLGHYLMDHTAGLGAVGQMPGFDDRYYYGHRPNGVYVPRFRNVDAPHADFLRGYALQGGAGRQGWKRGRNLRGIGADFKAALTRPGPWNMAFIGFGECLPYYENHVTLDEKKTDQWGIPLLKTSFSFGKNEQAMRKDIARESKAMLKSAGAKNIIATTEIGVGGSAIHEMGTARMGHDPAKSVLNRYNQCHDAPNVFVTDGACMTSSACQNPSLTYMALTARACDFAVQSIRDGQL